MLIAILYAGSFILGLVIGSMATREIMKAAFRQQANRRKVVHLGRRV